MHERIMDQFKKIDQVFDRVMGNVGKGYPTLENLQSNFPHKKGCSQSIPLISTERSDTFPGSGFEPSIRITASFLKCDECHEEKQYKSE